MRVTILKNQGTMVLKDAIDKLRTNFVHNTE